MRYVVFSMIVFCVAAVQAATWTGAEDGFWTNANNWVDHQIGGRYLAVNGDGDVVTNGVMASADDTAYFDTHGIGGATTIDFDGVVSISNLIVTGGATVPKYVFGTSPSQYVPILCDGTISFADTADTTLAELGGTIQGPIHALGNSNGDSPVTVNNNSATETLVLTRWGANPTYRPGAGSKRENGWTFAGSGTIRLDGDSLYSGSHQYKYRMSGTLQINCIFKKVRYFTIQRSYAHHIEILEGGEFRHGSGTLNNLSLSGTLVVDGPGKYCFASGVNSSGAALNGQLTFSGDAVFNCPVTSYCTTTKPQPPEGWYPGQLFLGGTGPVTFTGENNVTGTVQLLSSSPNFTYNASRLGLKGTQGAHGWGDFAVDNLAIVRFTGTEADVTDRDFCVTNAADKYEHALILDQAGTADFTVRSAFTKTANVAAPKLVLRNNGEAVGVFSGSLDAAYSLEMDGTGVWKLGSVLENTGATMLKAGTLEVLDGGALSASSALTQAGGTTLAFSGAAPKSCPTLKVAGSSAVLAVAAGTTVTINGFDPASSGLLDIQTADKTAIVKLSAGSTLPDWVTINGVPAEVDETGRIKKLSVAVDTAIAAYGGRIPNDGTKNVGVSTTGTASDGPIKLADGAGDAAAVKTLVQKVAVEAVVDLTAGQTLTAADLVVEEDAAPLTIGAVDGQGTLAAASGAFTLWPDGEDGLITVKASPDLAAATSIEKLGAGTAVFTKDFAFTKAVNMSAGTLAVTPQDDSTAQAFTLSGEGTFVKDGSAAWTVASGKNAGFLGDYVVRGGSVAPGTTSAGEIFGASAGGALVITNGATLKTHGGTLTAQVSFGSKSVHLADMGADGKGALVVDPAKSSANVTIKNLTLDADSGMVVPAANTGISYLGYQGVFDMQGHDFTRIGRGTLQFADTIVSNAATITMAGDATTTSLDTLQFVGAVSFPNTPGEVVLAATNTTVALHNSTLPIPAALTLATTSMVKVTSTSGDTNYNHWAGPVSLADGACLRLYASDNGANVLTLSGEISGNGSVEIPKDAGHYYFAMPVNSYTGDTIFAMPEGSGDQCVIGVAAWQTIPDFEKLTLGGVGGNGALALMASADRATWPDEKIVDLVDKMTIVQRNAIVGIDPLLSGDYSITASAFAALADKNVTFGAAALLEEDSPHQLTLALDQDWGGPNFSLGCYGSRMRVTGAHKVSLKDMRISSHNSRTESVLTLTGGAEIEFPGSDTAAILATHDGDLGILRVENASIHGTVDRPNPVISFGGVNTSYGLLEIGEGANLQARLYMGNHAGTRGSSVFQTGGRVVLGNGAAVGAAGPGYWKLEGGSVELTGGSITCGVSSNVCGTIEQTGGTIACTSSSTPFLGAQQNGYSCFYQSAGSLTVDQGKSNRAMEWPCSGNKCYDSVGVFTLAGATAHTTFASGMDALLANQTNGLAAINLNAGVLELGSLTGGDYPGSRAYVNFNGGTLKINRDVAALGTKNIAFTLGENGGTIDTDGHEVTLGKPITALMGGGVTAIALSKPVNSIAALKVTIAGDGDGATAMAIFDKTSRQITGIRVLSPGSGYTTATAYLNTGCSRQSSQNVKQTLACTILPNAAPGVLVKKGEGTLRLAAGEGLPAGASVDVQEGTLDLNGLANTLGNLTSSASGTVVDSAAGAVALPATLTVDVPAAAAGNYLTVSGDAALPSTLVLANIDQVPESTKSFTILKVAGAKTGTMSLATELPAGWTLEWTGDLLRVGRARGTRIFFR